MAVRADARSRSTAMVPPARKAKDDGEGAAVSSGLRGCARVGVGQYAGREIPRARMGGRVGTCADVHGCVDVRASEGWRVLTGARGCCARGRCRVRSRQTPRRRRSRYAELPRELPAQGAAAQGGRGSTENALWRQTAGDLLLLWWPPCLVSTTTKATAIAHDRSPFASHHLGGDPHHGTTCALERFRTRRCVCLTTASALWHSCSATSIIPTHQIGLCPPAIWRLVVC